MNSFKYKVSFRAVHPSDNLEFISDLIQESPKICWEAGDKRYTPKGNLLSGIRESSYFSASLTPTEISSDETTLEDFINTHIPKWETHIQVLNKFTLNSGKLTLFIGIFCNSNMGIELEPKLIQKLGKLNIGLQFDIYP